MVLIVRLLTFVPRILVLVHISHVSRRSSHGKKVRISGTGGAVWRDGVRVSSLEGMLLMFQNLG